MPKANAWSSHPWPLVYAVVPVVMLCFAFSIGQPTVFPDESGTLESARFLARGGHRSEWWYQPGYAVLLAPVARLSTDLGVLWRGAQVLNAVLATVHLVVLGVLGRRLFPEMGPLALRAGVVLVGLYPAYVYFGSWAIGDNALVVMVSVSTLLVLRSLQATTLLGALGWALPVALTAAIHSRGVVVVVAAALVLALHAAQHDRGRRFGVPAAVVASGAIAFLLARLALDQTGLAALSDDGRQSLSALLVANADLRSIAKLPLALLGQLLNVSVGSVGLVVVGFAHLARRSLLRRQADTSVVLSDFVLLNLGLSAVLATLFVNEGEGDLAFYGRYLEAVAAPILLVGVLVLLSPAGLPRWYRTLLPAAIAVAASGLVGIRGAEIFHLRFQRLNLAGLALPAKLAGGLDPLEIAVLGALAIVAVGWLSTVRVEAAVAVLVSIFAASAWLNAADARAYAERVAEETVLLDGVSRAMEAGAAHCVALDQTDLSGFWAQENYRVHRLDIAFPFWRSGEIAAVPCDVVISSRADLGDVLPGWSAIGAENGHRQWLWVAPSLARSSVLEPLVVRPAPGSPLDEGTAELTVLAVELDEDGETYELSVEIENTSDDVYVGAEHLPDSIGSVRLGVEWRSPESPHERIHEPFRSDFGLLRPGESAVIDIALRRSATPQTERGDGETWIIRLELVQEGVAWFEDAAAATAVVELG